MAALPKNEFASSEFAVFEFSYEAEADSGFLFVGESFVAIDSAARVSVTHQIEAYASTYLGGSILVPTIFESQGSATGHTDSSYALTSDLLIDAGSTGQFGVQKVEVVALVSGAYATPDLHGLAQANSTIEVIKAQASTELKGSIVELSELLIEAGSLVELDGDSSGNTFIYIDGTSDTSFVGGRALVTRSYITGRAATKFDGGRKLQGSFFTEGWSFTHFEPQDNPETLIRGRSTVRFDGFYTVNADLAAISDSEIELHGQARASTRLFSFGSAESQLFGQANRLANFNLRGRADTSIWTSRKHTGTFQAYGHSSGQMRGVGIVPGGFNATGLAQFTVKGMASSSGVYSITGFAVSDIQANEAQNATLLSAANSESGFYVGSVVFRSLPRAYDYVIREYEPRATVRMAEVRSAEFK